MTGEVVLKACPFCGGKPEFHDLNGYEARCECGLTLEADHGATKRQAITQWNTRASPCEDARAELVEALAMSVAEMESARAALVSIGRLRSASRLGAQCDFNRNLIALAALPSPTVGQKK